MSPQVSSLAVLPLNQSINETSVSLNYVDNVIVIIWNIIPLSTIYNYKTLLGTQFSPWWCQMTILFLRSWTTVLGSDLSLYSLWPWSVHMCRNTRVTLTNTHSHMVYRFTAFSSTLRSTRMVFLCLSVLGAPRHWSPYWQCQLNDRCHTHTEREGAKERDTQMHA